MQAERLTFGKNVKFVYIKLVQLLLTVIMEGRIKATAMTGGDRSLIQSPLTKATAMTDGDMSLVPSPLTKATAMTGGDKSLFPSRQNRDLDPDCLRRNLLESASIEFLCIKSQFLVDQQLVTCDSITRRPFHSNSTEIRVSGGL